VNLRVLGYLCFVVLIFSLIIGCAKKPFWGNEKTGFILSYRFAPNDVWKYQNVSTQTMNMEQMGQSIETNTKSFIGYTMKGNGLDKQQNLRATIVIDSISISSKGMGREMNPDLSSMVKKSFGLIFTPKGKELDLPGADSVTVDFGMMAGGKQSIKTFLRNILPDLAAKPIKVGESWTEQDTMNMKQGGMNINIKMESTHTLETLETMASFECLKIATKAKGTLEGSGQQMGADLTFEGDLEATGTWYFAYKNGMFVKSNTQNFMEGTIVVSGPANMSMPITQETKSEVTLVK
jgi:hypothetical protein